MAIQFARQEMGKRVNGANACHKSSYNSRDSVRDEKTGRLYDFSSRKDLLYHEIMLPEHADKKFLNKEYLWNLVEKVENRKDSQLYSEYVLALPDDKEFTHEMRIEVVRRFANEVAVKHGVPAQIDIHAPHNEKDKNHHAHLVMPHRSIVEDGQSLTKKKREDLLPDVRKGYVVEARDNGKLCADLILAVAREHGLKDFEIDPVGIVSQVHMGAKRMRDMNNENVYRNEDIKAQNAILAKDARLVLEQIVKQRSVFDRGDVERFLAKHARGVDNNLGDEIMKLGNVQRLHDKCTGEVLNKYTMVEVRHQEERLFRFLDKIDNRGVVDRFYVSSDVVKTVIDKQPFELSAEQIDAVSYVTSSDSGLKIVEGRAGSGKTSGVITPVREIYESAGYKVLGLAPTNKVVEDLRSSGFKDAMSCHKMLFRAKNGFNDIDSKTVVIIDEAGMVDTQAWLEMANVFKRAGAKIVPVKDDRQLQSIERGGVNIEMTHKYGSVSVEEVQRQRFEYSKEISRSMADGNWYHAVNLMKDNGLIVWSDTKELSIAQLVTDYSRDSLKEPEIDRFIIVQRNVDVDKINTAIHELRVERGEVGKDEFIVKVKEDLSDEYNSNDIEPEEKTIRFAIGDRVQFVKTSRGLHVNNGSFGTLRMATEDKFIVGLDNGKTVSFNPHEYGGLRLGYAGTIFKGEGSTFIDTYTLHDHATNDRNSYVGNSRNKDFGRLYANYEYTSGLGALIKQMSRSDTRESSLAYATAGDLAKNITEDNSLSGRAKEFLGAMGTKLGDMFHSNDKFYELDIKNINVESIEKSSFVFDVSDRTLIDTIKILNYVYSNEYKQSKQTGDDQDKSIVIDKKERAKIYSRAVDVAILIHNDYEVTGFGVSLDKVAEFEKLVAGGFKVDRKPYELELTRLNSHDEEVKRSRSEKDLKKEAFAEKHLQSNDSVDKSAHIGTIDSGQADSSVKNNSEIGDSDPDGVTERKIDDKGAVDPSSGVDDGSGMQSAVSTDSKGLDLSKGIQKVDKEGLQNIVDLANTPVSRNTPPTEKSSIADYDMRIANAEDMRVANGISAYRRIGKDSSGTSLSKHELNSLCRDMYGNIDVDGLVKSIANRDYVFNESMSTGEQLRYGEKGQLSINTTSGLYNNFETGYKGTLVSFVKSELGVGFKGALSHMRSYVNNRSVSDRLGSFLGDTSVIIDRKQQEQDTAALEKQAQIKAEQLAQQKQEKVLAAQQIFEKSVSTVGTQVERYLAVRLVLPTQGSLSHRISSQDISHDNIRYLQGGTKFNYNGKETVVYNGAMVVASRDNDNNIVGVQLTYLENGVKQLGRDGKPLNKFQYGILKDGLVQVGGNHQTNTKHLLNNDSTTSSKLHKGVHSSISGDRDLNSAKVVIVCEGVETALSVKQAIITDSNKDSIDIYASNGISNLTNIADRGYDKVLVCGDYDGVDAKSTAQTEKGVAALKEQDISVELVYPAADKNNPDKKLDFNDVICSENGAEKIQQAVLPALERLSPELMSKVDNGHEVNFTNSEKNDSSNKELTNLRNDVDSLIRGSTADSTLRIIEENQADARGNSAREAQVTGDGEDDGNQAISSENQTSSNTHEVLALENRLAALKEFFNYQDRDDRFMGAIDTLYSHDPIGTLEKFEQKHNDEIVEFNQLKAEHGSAEILKYLPDETAEAKLNITTVSAFDKILDECFETVNRYNSGSDITQLARAYIIDEFKLIDSYDGPKGDIERFISASKYGDEYLAYKDNPKDYLSGKQNESENNIEQEKQKDRSKGWER